MPTTSSSEPHTARSRVKPVSEPLITLGVTPGVSEAPPVVEPKAKRGTKTKKTRASGTATKGAAKGKPAAAAAASTGAPADAAEGEVDA